MNEGRGYLTEGIGAKESSSAESNASEPGEGNGSSGRFTFTDGREPDEKSRFTFTEGRESGL